MFAPGDVAREVVAEAVRAAGAVTSSEEWSFVAVDSPAARRRVAVAATGTDHGFGAAPILIVPCVRVAGSTSTPRTEDAVLLTAGAAIRTLGVALHSQLVGWSWDPDLPIDAEGLRAALALGEEWRPLGVVAVGRMPEGGATRPRPPDPTDALDWRA